MNSVVFFILISFIVAIALGPIIIPILRRLKMGQNIRVEGPKSHRVKSGTPAMGGFIFILASIITLFAFRRVYTSQVVAPLMGLILFSSIGFIDDYLKMVHKKNEGLKPRQKMLLLIIVASGMSYFGYVRIGTEIIIPFLNVSWDLGWFYMPAMIFFFTAVTNAVNLTDGLDGLATSISLLIITFFAVLSYVMNYLDLSITCAVLVGALLGFLKYNAYPAKVFMGDMGSIALGGFIATVAMMLKNPLIVIIVAGIPLMETLSVIIQVISFKSTGKRVFKMAPLHHHFELCGWHETRVVVIFSIITVVLCLVSFLVLSL
ncbi:Phospho-N-acetylmuramoyl-pentapeptide-transferase [Hathewaya proteolytica DSM 3090]|uniref:Phospho-N-acetylmuramoyl-pentapeptide-transferase n=1 Tax=Hathewaya proteolytica DSM 3090 TaxID=1121331 RepID=A0A1M6L7F9_9CLOT|nr:phospho-N-acetylmuramoyl-pentapeptide-transferase [Hathewaya proteolytica]SHJ67132.1 Phospho-N-acetylmuramoyl-pentapeptide-transferase [Hathewaya proteolytica DSM 3090]